MTHSTCEGAAAKHGHTCRQAAKAALGSGPDLVGVRPEAVSEACLDVGSAVTGRTLSTLWSPLLLLSCALVGGGEG